ncbi:retrotransposon protein, putative, ty1-copia subclass [Tanacetum coccineum]
MTTSSANNSAFRGFFEKQKLTGPDFIDWYRQLRIVVSVEDKLNYLEHPILAAPVPTQAAEQELLQTMREFHSCKQEEGQSVSSYILKMKSYIDNLERLGPPCHLALDMGKTINELHAMPKLHEQTLPKNNAPALHAIRAGKEKNKLAYAPKPKIPPPPKREDPAKDSVNKKLSQGASGSGIFTIELYTFPNKSWVYDTGCGTHICNTTQGLRGSRKLKPGALSLGIISVSRLYDDGYVNRFVDNSIQVSRNNMVYFSAIPRDGIFEIDLSDSYTNVSSMYALSNKRAKSNLDSALLWHCRLGHISKKRIEKLQHDGLLNSTDLRAFEKCVPCMSGKMARKPYTHQVERAKDLLGLIHTDVCGPFKIVSRQGASYFVTFTDDFSRYSYVYLLKHKHEVFKTFKVFQKEVENQLGKTIKSLRSNRGGEYMSQEFLDHLKDHEIIANRTPPYTPQHNKNSLITQEASGSLEDLEIIQEEDTHPSIDTSLNHEEDDLEIDEPQSDIIPIRRSTRTRNAPNRMCLYIDAEEHELGDLGEPANYKAALLDPESDKWLNAMNVEMQSMKDNEVWDLVDLPPNGKTVGSKWLFKKKTDMDGAVHTFKARLVAKGFTQTYGVDYEETFSPVADIRAIRILIAIAAYYDYEIWQMDVKTAFLNGHLSEEVYMEQPEGFVNPKYPNRKFGFTQNRDEPCVYLKASRSNVTFLILYVDDILIMGNNIPMLQDVKSYLGRCFAMKDLGEAAYILGIKIYRDRSRRLIGLCQSAYIEKILKRFHMENSKRGSIPMQEKLRLSKSQGASTPAELKRMQNVPYASAVSSVTNTKDMFLVYEGDIKRELRVSCYTDKSTKQCIFATSSAKAEYIAAYDASKEAVWVRKFISGLGVVPTIEEPINMYCDNTGAITIANESGITKGARHFRAKVHYLREVIEFGDIKLEKVHTDDNLADPFTKALAFPKHSEHTKNIGMLPASSLM